MRLSATIDSSLSTYSSLLMAAIERPAPAERMAVFEAKELPGNESRIDCAFFFGSSAGTLDADRMDVNEVVSAGNV